jgi:hypothetical protein
MSSIYKNAQSVISWLGFEDDDSDLAVDYISTLPKKDVWCNDHSWDTWPGHHCNMPILIRTALRKLFNRPYWTRLWIIQEVRLARKVMFLCGSKELSWDDVMQYMSGQEWTKYSNVQLHYKTLSSHVLHLFLFENIENFWVSPPPIKQTTCSGKLWRLVDSYCYFSCIDPRDKIYGLLGLMDEAEVGIEVDYNKTVEEVFLTFLHVILNSLEPTSARAGGSALPVRAINMKLALDEWWWYADRVCSCWKVDFDSVFDLTLHSLSRNMEPVMANVLGEEMQHLQSEWVNKGWLRPEDQIDAVRYFYERWITKLNGVDRRRLQFMVFGRRRVGLGTPSIYSLPQA